MMLLFKQRPKFRESPILDKMKTEGREGYQSNALLVPRPIHYSNVRLVVGERETIHKVGDVAYATMDP